MRKKIGIFMGEIISEYQEVVVKTIFRKAGEAGYDVFTFCNFGAYGDNVLYAEGEKSVIRIPDLEKLDGIIVADDTFDIDGMEAEFFGLLKEKAKCPVVYLRNPNDVFYNVLVEDGEAIADITRHFIKHHGFRDICFMTGNMNSEDARKRHRWFLTVMEEEKIPVTEHMVFNGDWWREKGKKAVDWFMEGRSSYPQAIICSNDHMALSVCDELKRRGVRVPEDVCVSGYDDIMEARRYHPSITSVRAPFEALGKKAVEIIEKVNKGEEQERVVWLKPGLELRRSCGCGGQELMNDCSALLHKIYVQENDVKQTVCMTTEYQDAFEESEYLKVAEKYFANTNCSKAYLCMCDEEERDFDRVELDNAYTNRMILKRIFYRGQKADSCEEKFDRCNILPKVILERENAEGYLVFPVHYKSKCYGYMVMLFEDENWADVYVQSYMMGLANAIEEAAMHREVSSLEQIKTLYHKDALTGIYNRRGFEKQLRNLHERYEEEEKFLSIVSIDMNGLKYINDNFGHSEGDEALCRLANILNGLVKEDEICARVGGDEYFVLLYSDERKRELEFAEQFIRAMREDEEKVKKPYPFRASFGICCISDEQELSLMSCMQLADKRMYVQKKQYKMMQEKFL
ncbi:MAG: GGDEF domain-containing protein [Bacillota bacterium]|nr:GGDEF domain-containing protein [Bacillota bacterium]